MTSFLDFRSAWRNLAAARGVTIVAAAMMALGIGLNAAVSAVAYSVLLRPLPYRDAGRLVVIAPRDWRDTEDGSFSLEESRLWRERLQTISSAAAWASEELAVRGAGEPVMLKGALVDGPFFETLGASPRAGRLVDGDPALAVVGPAVAARIGGNDAVGSAIGIGPRTHRVSGVMPAEFTFPSDDTAFWVPANGLPAIHAFGSTKDRRRFVLVGRTRPGVSVAEVEADARLVISRLEPEFGNPKQPRSVIVRSVEDRLLAPARPVLRVFIAGGLIILVIACANAATLLVGRAIAREREIAVKLALGAGPSRLLKSFLIESAMLASAGAVAGIACAYVLVRLFAASAAAFLPRAAEARVGLPVLAWSIAIATGITLVCGVLPALHALKTEYTDAFRQRAATPKAGARRLRGVLVVVQVTLATVLLVSAGLLIRTVAHLAHTETGIEPNHALAMRLMLTETTRFDADARGPLVRAMLDRVRALPGVTSAGIGSNLPPGRSQIQLGVSLVDRNKPVVNLMASLASVTAGYLDAIGARTVAGRRFEDGDLTRGDHVAILSATAARVLFPDRDPIGVQLPFALPGTKINSRVIGIVGDVRYEGLETSSVAAIYVPWSDLPVGMTYLVVRTDRDPLATAPAIVRTLRTLDPGLPVPSPHPLTAEIADLLAQRRMRAILGGGFAAAALLVALVGLAGMLARLVAERRREIAIRAALGATPRDGTHLVVRDGVVLATMGVIVGLAGSFVAARGLSQLLYGVTAYDGITYLVVASGLLILAVFACYVPARRAAQVEPLELLRAE